MLLVALLSSASCARATEPPLACKSGSLVLYDSDDQTIVKKSRTGVCHDNRSPNFDGMMHYTAYRSMSDCVTSGGKERGRS